MGLCSAGCNSLEPANGRPLNFAPMTCRLSALCTNAVSMVESACRQLPCRFDDLPTVNYVRPQLTVGCVPAQRMGELAATRIIEALRTDGNVNSARSFHSDW
jgi:hypothetical protein